MDLSKKINGKKILQKIYKNNYRVDNNQIN